MDKRKITCEIEIAADAESVWQALTEAEHVKQWFAPNVEGQSGPEGYLSLSWSTRNDPMRLDFVDYDPPWHLKTTWHAAPEGMKPILLPVEIELESIGQGTTRLTLVQSGFLSDESWDDEFQSHQRGWNTELRHLRYYVEEQFNRTRAYFLERLAVPPTFSIDSFIGASGQLRADLRDVAEGESFELMAAEDECWQCRLLYRLATSDLVFICDALDGGVIRLAIEGTGGNVELWMWAFSWSMSDDELTKRIQPVYHQLRERLGV